MKRANNVRDVFFIIKKKYSIKWSKSFALECCLHEAINNLKMNLIEQAAKKNAS
jgi:hypothetical protein